MLKLIKYEFCKARTMFAALLGVAAALEVYFLVSLKLGRESHVVASLALLMLCAGALTLFALVRGVTSYSGELSRRSGWLVFMTPNSTLKIVASKFAYTFLNGLFFAALIAGVSALDLRLTMSYYGEWESFLEGLRSMLSMQGVPVNEILAGIAFGVAYGFLAILSEIALAYLAITLSCTMFGEKRWRWLPSLVLFALLSWLVNWICGRFPSPVDQLFVLDEAMSARSASVSIAMRKTVVPSLLPTMLVSLGTILLSMFGCSAMLKKWVSL